MFTDNTHKKHNLFIYVVTVLPFLKNKVHAPFLNKQMDDVLSEQEEKQTGTAEIFFLQDKSVTERDSDPCFEADLSPVAPVFLQPLFPALSRNLKLRIVVASQNNPPL